MLAELISSIRGLSVKANEPKIIEVGGVDAKRWITQDGTMLEVPIPAPRRHHKIRSLNDLTAALVDPVIAAAPEVYFSPKSITAVLDRNTRRDTITLEVEYSERWAEIERLAKGVALSSKEAVHYLRHQMHGEEVAEVLSGVRRIQFDRSSTGKRTVEHGRESLGRSVEEQVQNADKIPEYFVLHAFPARNQGLRGIEVSVRIAVTIDFDNEKIVFRALADEVENARHIFAQEMGELLRKSLPIVPVFNGEV